MQLFIYFSLQVVALDTITGQIFDKIHATNYTQQQVLTVKYFHNNHG